MTPQERLGLDLVPIGREFGSKDYERLEVPDMYFYGQISAQKAMGILEVDESGFAAMMKTEAENRSVPELIEYRTRIGKAAVRKLAELALNAYAETIRPNSFGPIFSAGMINAPSGAISMKSRITANCRSARVAITNL